MRKRTNGDTWSTNDYDHESSGSTPEENFLLDFGDDLEFGVENNPPQEDAFDTAPSKEPPNKNYFEDFASSDEDSAFPENGSWNYQSTKKKRSNAKKLLGIMLVIVFGICVILSFGKKAQPDDPSLPTVDSNIDSNVTPTNPPIVTEADQTPQDEQDVLSTYPPMITEPPENPPLIQNQAIYYARSLLSQEEQNLYDIIYEAIYRMSEIKGLRVSYAVDVDTLIRFVTIDHPELFWYSGSWSGMELDNGDGTRNMDMTFHFNCTQAEREQTQKIIDAYAEDCLRGLEYLDQYNQVKAVYEYIINNTVYDYDYYGQTIEEIMVNHRGVCASYARTTQYLLQQLGFEIVTVFGYGHEESHLWNMLKVEGDYYLLDTTWGDPLTDTDAEQTINYTYFLVTTEFMAKDHRVDDVIPLPYCSATSCNYFIREGRYFEYYDRNRFLDLMRQDVAAGRNTEMKFSSIEVYNTFLSIISDGGQIYPMFEELGVPGFNTGSCSYSCSEDNLGIKIIYEFY